MILSEWERRQIYRRGEPSCMLCGLNWIARDTLQSLNVDANLNWCKDTVACGERWLRKFLSGRIASLESLTVLGNGPRKQGVFEVAYHTAGSEALTKRVVMPEVRPGGDMHRRIEHYHLIEFGKDVTDTFTP